MGLRIKGMYFSASAVLMSCTYRYATKYLVCHFLVFPNYMCVYMLSLYPTCLHPSTLQTPHKNWVNLSPTKCSPYVLPTYSSAPHFDKSPHSSLFSKYEQNFNCCLKFPLSIEKSYPLASSLMEQTMTGLEIRGCRAPSNQALTLTFWGTWPAGKCHEVFTCPS